MGTIQVAGRELKFKRDAARISGPNGEVRFPSEPGKTKSFGNRVFVAIRMEKDGAADPTFEVDNPTRDLVAITPDCRVDWIVKETPSLLETDKRHRVIVPVHDRLLTRTAQGGHFFEVDPETGDVVDDWKASEFVINGKSHQLGSRATIISAVRNKTIVNTKNGALFGFDADGTHLWTYHDDFDWKFGNFDGRYYLAWESGRIPHTKAKFEFDVDRGVIVGPLNAPDRVVDIVFGDSK